jgi:hypothetical protein
MRSNARLRTTKRIGTGLCFVVFPLVFVFAFSVHPNLATPHFLSPSGLIARAHHAELLHVAHALVTLVTALLVVVALHFMALLERFQQPWWGFVGGTLAILGSLALAADKGALCLTMSSLESLTDAEFEDMMPGLVAMFSKQGWLVLIWGVLLLPIGFGIQAIGLLRSGALPRWQSVLFLIGVLFIGTPDGAEAVNLVASLLMAIALVPYGAHLIRNPGSGHP